MARRSKAKNASRSGRPSQSRYWSAEVTKHSDALDLEKGVFAKKSPRQVALSLQRSAEASRRRKSSPYRSAMSMLTFYMNRAGRHLGKNRLQVLQEAKHELRKVFGREDGKGEKSRMPKMASKSKVKQSELPSTLRRSSAKAQRTFAKAHDSAAKQYGEGERAHRAAYGALKHSFERKGDRWVAKDGKGPSDPRSKHSTEAKRKGRGETYGGVDVEGNTKQELYERAQRLDVAGRSKMSKRELARAISRRQ